MNCYFQLIDKNIEISASKPAYLFLEDPHVFRQIVESLLDCSNNLSDEVVLSNGGSIINLSKISDLIIDPFHIDMNNRRILSGLYNELAESMQSYEDLEYSKWLANTVEMMERVLLRSVAPISFSCEIACQDLFKAVHVKVDDEVECPTDRFISYLRLMHQYCGTEIFFLVNMSLFFDEQELSAIKQSAEYENIALVFLEGECKSIKEECIIIDKDFCTIEL